jgi:hypothetical protein
MAGIVTGTVVQWQVIDRNGPNERVKYEDDEPLVSLLPETKAATAPTTLT